MFSDLLHLCLPGVLRTVNPHLQYLARPLLKEHILLLLRQRSLSSLIDGLWHRAFENYGLQRPTDVTEIHVFRVILQSSWDKNACTRSVTRTDPMGDPFQTLERIIDEWSDLELEEHDQSWRLSPVNSACTWSSTNELSSPAYVLTRKGKSFPFPTPSRGIGSSLGTPTVDNGHCPS